MATYVITGAASGIGAASRRRLESDGHTVIGVDIAHTDVVADLSTPGGRSAAAAAIDEASGGVVHGLVCCAGLGSLSRVSGGTLAAVNFFGAVDLAIALKPALERARGASVVVISSSSTTTQPGIPKNLVAACLDHDEPEAVRIGDEVTAIPAYPASKLALAWWIRREAVRPEWIGKGIRLNAIAPGMIDTPMTNSADLDPELAKALDFYPIPLGRRGRPDEIAALIAFLLGPDSTLFCGSVVFADGGTDAQLRQQDWPAEWTPTTEELTRHFQAKT
ncbi:NAD-dependent epimerase [Rhodococcus sp. WMMA185]|uniref:SDR family oxidoreductase n=1 Tax=Rhodococcus sp. WMMA185 TaxID=679318 RepID=UPI0008788F5C|nr:SDR family oxidoreductase [Rhodococcus sp. WMMA185]AOW92241.1 NAD-dependent epimerase [Rhodococcus sp. WMMA185]